MIDVQGLIIRAMELLPMNDDDTETCHIILHDLKNFVRDFNDVKQAMDIYDERINNLQQRLTELMTETTLIKRFLSGICQEASSENNPKTRRMS